MPITVPAAPAAPASIAATRAFYEQLAAGCDGDVAQIELALAHLAELELDEATLGGFQSAQEDAQQAAARARRVLAELAGHRVMEDAVNATPDAARTAFYQEGRPAQLSQGAEVPTMANADRGDADPAAGAPATDAEAPGAPGDDQAERQRILADRRAKADVIGPMSRLVWSAQSIGEAAEDDDEDPSELLQTLLAAVRKTASDVGLDQLGEQGEQTTYDPERHTLLGGRQVEPETPVYLLRPGQTWTHDSRKIVVWPAWVTLYDQERGAHLVGTASSLDEEGADSIWLDDTTPRRPDHYSQPGWYAVEAVEDCDGDDDCPNRSGHCDGYQLWIAACEADAQAVHYARDDTVIQNFNPT